jgi:hypothetical protein
MDPVVHAKKTRGDVPIEADVFWSNQIGRTRLVEPVIEAISNAAQTGKMENGKYSFPSLKWRRGFAPVSATQPL